MNLSEILKSDSSLTLVVGKDDKVRRFTRRGVMDLLDLYDNHRQFLSGSQVADKVVGHAAAAFMALAPIASMDTDVITSGAIEMLERYGIPYTYRALVPMVENRDHTGRCPLDTICDTLDSPEQMVDAIRDFYRRLDKRL